MSHNDMGKHAGLGLFITRTWICGPAESLVSSLVPWDPKAPTTITVYT